jgi:hypothetical protein
LNPLLIPLNFQTPVAHHGNPLFHFLYNKLCVVPQPTRVSFYNEILMDSFVLYLQTNSVILHYYMFNYFTCPTHVVVPLILSNICQTYFV